MPYGDARGGFKGNEKSHLDGWPRTELPDPRP